MQQSEITFNMQSLLLLYGYKSVRSLIVGPQTLVLKVIVGIFSLLGKQAKFHISMGLLRQGVSTP